MCQTGPDEKGSKGKTMRKTLLPLVTLSALALPAAALAQAACPAAPPPPDPCLVGNWVGENTALQAFTLAMPAMAAAGVSVETIPGPPPVLGMTIYEDGFYETLPIHADALNYISDRDGTAELSIDLSMPTQIGHVWGAGGRLEFCDMGIIAPEVRMGLVAPDGASGDTDFTVGFGSFTPGISYACTGDTWTFTVDLPPPIGAVDYRLYRFPDTRFADEFMTEHRYRRDADPSD